MSVLQVHLQLLWMVCGINTSHWTVDACHNSAYCTCFRLLFATYLRPSPDILHATDARTTRWYRLMWLLRAFTIVVTRSLATYTSVHRITNSDLVLSPVRMACHARSVGRPAGQCAPRVMGPPIDHACWAGDWFATLISVSAAFLLARLQERASTMKLTVVIISNSGIDMQYWYCRWRQPSRI